MSGSPPQNPSNSNASADLSKLVAPHGKAVAGHPDAEIVSPAWVPSPRFALPGENDFHLDGGEFGLKGAPAQGRATGLSKLDKWHRAHNDMAYREVGEEEEEPMSPIDRSIAVLPLEVFRTPQISGAPELPEASAASFMEQDSKSGSNVSYPGSFHIKEGKGEERAPEQSSYHTMSVMTSPAHQKSERSSYASYHSGGMDLSLFPQFPTRNSVSAAGASRVDEPDEDAERQRMLEDAEVALKLAQQLATQEGTEKQRQAMIEKAMNDNQLSREEATKRQDAWEAASYEEKRSDEKAAPEAPYARGHRDRRPHPLARQYSSSALARTGLKNDGQPPTVSDQTARTAGGTTSSNLTAPSGSQRPPPKSFDEILRGIAGSGPAPTTLPTNSGPAGSQLTSVAAPTASTKKGDESTSKGSQ
ncbi:hypothetical protein QFC24_004486 [Naganishia onofrii]|uniref:Uncharacterized protein n=1 Tax=Naganishia onofrii TaxID=1851511 RepID=A0ACC2XET5_9TREE|nr:hypothetical protein QFC24_004486 [Naganishia onofrii]